MLQGCTSRKGKAWAITGLNLSKISRPTPDCLLLSSSSIYIQNAVVSSSYFEVLSWSRLHPLRFLVLSCFMTSRSEECFLPAISSLCFWPREVFIERGVGWLMFCFFSRSSDRFSCVTSHVGNTANFALRTGCCGLIMKRALQRDPWHDPQFDEVFPQYSSNSDWHLYKTADVIEEMLWKQYGKRWRKCSRVFPGKGFTLSTRCWMLRAIATFLCSIITTLRVRTCITFLFRYIPCNKGHVFAISLCLDHC